MSADSDTLQTARASYDPALLAEASGFAEVAEPPRVLSLEPLQLDLEELGEGADESDAPAESGAEPSAAPTTAHAGLEPRRASDTQPGLGAPIPAPRAVARQESCAASALDGTLVLPLPALNAADKTLVLPAPLPRQVEHTLVIAAPPVTVLTASGSIGDGGAETRIVPLEEWAPAASSAKKAEGAACPQRAGPLTDLLRQFRELPMRRRILVVLAPVTAFALLSSYLGPSPSSETGGPAAPAAPSPRSAVTMSRSVPAAWPAASAVVPQPSTASARAAHGKTLQRAAADAVAEGNAAAALTLYRKLAAAEPDVPAYRAATRILEERVRGAEQPQR